MIKIKELEFLPDHLYEEANYIAHGLLDDVSDELSGYLWSSASHFVDDMPYGTAKARDGDPDEWIFNKLERLLNDEIPEFPTDEPPTSDELEDMYKHWLVDSRFFNRRVHG